MDGSEWVGIGIAGLALVVSGVNAVLAWRWRWEDTRKADVTVYFHRTQQHAQIHLPDGVLLKAGYHLVLWNRGPATAHNVKVEVFGGSGKEVRLLDVAPEEFPLSLLGSGARYPIPWLLSDKKTQDERRFRCRIEWSDKAGKQSTEVPLRRGETSV